MGWILLGVLAVIAALIWNWLAVIYVMLFIGYNIYRFIIRWKDGTIVSAILINGLPMFGGVMVLFWAFR